MDEEIIETYDGMNELMKDAGYKPDETEWFAKNFDRLNHESQAVLIMRYGLGEFEPHTYREIGSNIGELPGQVHALVKRAISFLQRTKFQLKYDPAAKRRVELYSPMTVWAPPKPELKDENCISCLGLPKRVYTKLLSMNVLTVGKAREAVKTFNIRSKGYFELNMCLKNFDREQYGKENMFEASTGSSIERRIGKETVSRR